MRMKFRFVSRIERMISRNEVRFDQNVEGKSQILKIF